MASKLAIIMTTEVPLKKRPLMHAGVCLHGNTSQYGFPKWDSDTVEGSGSVL